MNKKQKRTKLTGDIASQPEGMPVAGLSGENTVRGDDMLKAISTMFELECQRCTVEDPEMVGEIFYVSRPFRWYPRVPKPKVCPNCHSRLWNVPREKRGV